MKIEIYVNWETREVLNKKEFDVKKKIIEQEIKEDCFQELLADYLIDNDFSILEIYNLSKEKKEDIEKKVLAICKDEAEQDMESVFETITLEV